MKLSNSLKYLSQSDQDLVSREQLAEHSRTVRAAVFANVVNLSILFVLFYKQIPLAVLILCTGLFIYSLIVRVANFKKMVADLSASKDLLKLKKSITRNAVILAYIWGVIIAFLITVASPIQLMILAVIGAGKMSTGVITYKHMPEAAKAWTVILAVCLTVGLLFLNMVEGYFVIGLLSMFSMVLIMSNKTTFANFVNRILSQKEIEDAADTVRLLLHDFEEQSSNWLFSVDQHGFLIDVCDRFAEAANRSKAELTNIPLISLMDKKDEKLELMDFIARGRSFRDMVVSVNVDDEKRWWSITGRSAKKNKNGQKIAMRGVISDITAQKKAEEKVSYMAHFDGLTDLPNRRFFSETLNHTLNRADADDDIALLLFDLDHFKAINDTLGHPIGDKFLKVVSRKLEGISKSDDMLARLGGDEFALMLTGERARNAQQIADELIRKVGEPLLIDDHNIVSSASLGLAYWKPEMKDPEILIKYADLALYSAKGTGRNRIAEFEEGMDKIAEERRNLELDLRGSVGRDELRLHYQPLVNLETQEKTGYEALLRWEHPERGVVMPDQFISVAEETGMIIQLGEWVIRQALQDAAQWSDELSVAVNLSPTQMRSSGLVPTIVNALAQSGVDPSRLELEITESILMHDSESNIQTLHSLRELGIRISLDDFGTGYSSLNYLRSFPFDKIKIDRCFVSEIDSRDDCRAIIRSVIGLAQSLGMTTTAEGVEREDQLVELRAEGCDQVQGFLYGKAEALETATDLRAEDRLIPNVEKIYLPASKTPIGLEEKRKKA